ncbi:hypothetical protein ACQ4PT_052978 [Festuca glaucescens]
MLLGAKGKRFAKKRYAEKAQMKKTSDLWQKKRFSKSSRLAYTKVNVSELGLVTPSGKVVWGKYAQVTNNPENDGCINAGLLV